MWFIIQNRRVGSDRGNLSLILSLLLVFTGLLSPLLSLAAVPLATTQVSKLCELRAGDYDYDQYDSGQQTYEQATGCDLSVPNAMAEGNGSAGFGPGIPQIGITSTSAQVIAVAPGWENEANFEASVVYFFEIQPIGADPGITQLPVLFSVRGQGNAVTGQGSLARTAGYVNLFGNGVTYGDASFVFDLNLIENQNQGDSLNGTKYLNLYPNNIYGVTMSAVSEAWGLSASSTAYIDPFIGFDQSTFDAYMASIGQTTFALNNYYRLVFSENLPLPPTPVPEPGILILLGISMVSIVGFRRRWKE